MFVLCRQKADLVTPLLHNLYWLPIQAHIDFKITMLHYRVVHGLAPFYLCEVSPYQPGKSSPCLRYSTIAHSLSLTPIFGIPASLSLHTHNINCACECMYDLLDYEVHLCHTASFPTAFCHKHINLGCTSNI